MNFAHDPLAGRSTTHLSDLDLDCLVAGDLAPDQASRLRAHVDGCPDCTTRLARLAVDPPGLRDAQVLAAIRRRLDVAPRRSWLRDARFAWLVAALGAAAAVFLLLRPRDPSDPVLDPGPGVRMKGDLRLTVLRRLGAGAEPVIAGDVIRPTDDLSFTVSLPDRGRIAVLGIEPDGTLYAAWPLPSIPSYPLASTSPCPAPSPSMVPPAASSCTWCSAHPPLSPGARPTALRSPPPAPPRAGAPRSALSAPTRRRTRDPDGPRDPAYGARA